MFFSPPKSFHVAGRAHGWLRPPWIPFFSFVLISLLAFAPAAIGNPIDMADPPEGRFWDEWMEVMLANEKVGYSRFSITRSGDRIEVREVMTMRLARHLAEVNLEVARSSVETLSGEPLAFRSESTLGQLPLVMEGVIINDELSVTTRQAGNVQERRYPWVDGALMNWGTIRESFRRGFEPGVEYSIPVFNPDLRLDGPVDSMIRIAGNETVTVRELKISATRIETRLEVPMGSFESVSWVDSDGRTLISKMNMGGLDITMVSATESIALKEFVPPEIFDSALLAANVAIPRGAQSVTYVITFPHDGDDFIEWPETRQQEILASSPGKAVIRVTRGEHAATAVRHKKSDRGDEDLTSYLAANAAINSADGRLIALGREALGEGLNASQHPFATADRLRRFATGYISEKNLDVGFATASEVARRPVGDCTEHAVFLAALGRVCEIPSRVAVGLAYVSEYAGRENVFGVHMWTQMYLHDQWIDLDASLGESECSPTRIAFLTGSLDDGRPVDVMLPMMKLLGQIKVEISKVEI
jgi:hypothetical protein